MSDSELSSNSLESKLLDRKRNVIRMSSPRASIEWFRRELHAAGVQFAIPSGQACVHFGIQQTTKDSDWISEAADRYALARSPLDDSARCAAFAAARADAAEILAATEEASNSSFS